VARPAIELGPRYRPLRRLGRGGLGDVWLVRDTFLRKDLALKLLHRLPVGPEELGEVRREFTLLSRLEHPGLARAHDFSFLGERPCFTAEFIPGAMPGGKRGICEPAGLLRIARDVAEAIAFLHRNEILHLDIKPGNIIVRRDTGRAVLIDFGLCRRGLASTAGEKIKGSLPYMAPEYFEPGPLGPWTDVYALGVTLYRLATGRFPRSSGAPRRTSDRGRRGLPAWDAVPLPPSRLRPGLPGHLDHIILKCLALDPRSRFRSGGELLASLESALPPAPAAGGGDGWGGAAPPPPPPRPGRRAGATDPARPPSTSRPSAAKKS
jgi:serine/threonine protein kinase